MGQEIGRTAFTEADFTRFHDRLEAETKQLEAFSAAGGFSDERFVAGFELEAWLLDHSGYPSPINEAYLKRLNSPWVVPELSRFNVELNGAPLPLGPGTLGAMEQGLTETWAKSQAVAHDMDAVLAMIGILPTIRQRDLNLTNISALNRYVVLNEQVLKQRGGKPIHIRISGKQDSLDILCPDVMLEAATTSFQVHLQVPERLSPRYYNASLISCAPLLAAGANSPYLFRRRLWEETRVPLFEQSVEAGGYGGLDDTRVRRVGFGLGYVQERLMELFRENLERFPVLLPMQLDEAGDRFPHVRLHNGAIWRWVRPLIGFDAAGRAHVRIEQRVLPSGPSLVDMVANAAFYYGLVRALAEARTPPETVLGFEQAKANAYAAARQGLGSEVVWLEGGRHTLRNLILDELLPLACVGLADFGLDEAEAGRYLDIIDQRVRSGQTGSVWQVRCMECRGGDTARMMADYIENQRSGAPVHEWEL